MSKLKSRVILVNDKRTSVRLCNSEWIAFEDICKREGISRKNLIEMIEAKRSKNLGLTGSMRLFSIVYYHNLAEQIKNNKKQIDNVIDGLFPR